MGKTTKTKYNDLATREAILASRVVTAVHEAIAPLTRHMDENQCARVHVYSAAVLLESTLRACENMKHVKLANELREYFEASRKELRFTLLDSDERKLV